MPPKAGASPAPAAPRASLAGTLASAPAYAAVYAAAAIAVFGVLAYYAGSYVAWSAFWIVLAFWTLAAIVAGIAAAAVLAPFAVLAKGGVRRAVVSTPIVAAGFALTGLVIKPIIAGRDGLGAGIILTPWFLAGWGALLAVAAAGVASRTRSPHRSATLVLVAGMLAGAGLAPYVPNEGCAFALAAVPVAFLAAGAAWLEKARSRWARALAVPAAFLVCAAAVVIAGTMKGQPPLGPAYSEPPAGAPARAAEGKPNVVILVIDTMRADHTSLLGYKLDTTPRLKALAAESRLYRRGVSTASSTLPAHGSLFTGVYPREHGAHGGTDRSTETMEGVQPSVSPLDPSRETLATCLANEGYYTGGIVANYSRACRQLGLGRGFRYYYDLPRFLMSIRGVSSVYSYALDRADTALGLNGKLVQPFWGARKVSAMAKSWVAERRSQPFFLFLNYMDCHCPYAAPPPFDKLDGKGAPYDRTLRMDKWQPLYQQFMRTGKGLTPELLASAVNQYDGGLAYADHYVGEFIEGLKREGLYDNTLLIVTSDHGEFFGEHGLLVHRMEVYEPGVRIPILVKYPRGAHAGEVSDARVSILDIFATVLDCVGAKPRAVVSQPLDRVTHPILAESYDRAPYEEIHGVKGKRRLAAIYSGDLKYTWSLSGRRELYDLANDAGELKDLVTARPDITARLDKEVADWLASTPAFEHDAAASAPQSRRGGVDSGMGIE